MHLICKRLHKLLQIYVQYDNIGLRVIGNDTDNDTDNGTNNKIIKLRLHYIRYYRNNEADAKLNFSREMGSL